MSPMWRPRPASILLQSPLLWLVLGAVMGALLASGGTFAGLQGESCACRLHERTVGGLH